MSQLAKDNNTFAASWQLYDAERMANERLRQQLAEALSVRENCTLVPTHELKKLHEQLTESEAERLEQARLLGMSGEREAGLLAEIERLKGMVDEIQAARHVLNEHNGLLIRLAAGQAREQRSMEVIEAIQDYAQEVIDRRVYEYGEDFRPLQLKAMRDDLEKSQKALALPQDTTALSAMIAKAGEVMRERCVNQCVKSGAAMAWGCAADIRKLPIVTLGDIK